MDSLQFARSILFVLFHKKEYILGEIKAVPNRLEYVLAFILNLCKLFGCEPCSWLVFFACRICTESYAVALPLAGRVSFAE
jgi:hypothetical protein